MMKSILRNCKSWHPPYTRRKRRNRWFNPRAEEAKDKIYRIPPPGNGNKKQTNITDFFNRMQLSDNTSDQENVTQQHQQNGPSQQGDHLTNQIELKILQWNANSMNEEKRKQLEFLTDETKIDVIVRLQPRWRLCSCRNPWSSPAHHLPAAYHFARGPSFTRALFVRGWVRDAPALISSIREP